MAKMQNDFYQQYVGSTNTATYTANQVLTALIELAKTDTTSNVIQITLPNTSGSDILDSKEVYILDQGNAATNAVTVIPHGSDSTTIEGLTSYLIDVNNQGVVFKLMDGQWLIVADSNRLTPVGSLGFAENTTDTSISTSDTYVDITGTAVSGELVRFTRSGSVLTYVGLNTIKVKVLASLSVENGTGGGKRDIRAAIVLNSTEKAAFSISMDAEVKNVVIIDVLSISTNDTIKVQVKNTENIDDILVVDYDLTAEEL